MTVVVGTAGHIDHGKTTLLRALTGIDADRLPEEQRRGMTIDVGYAHMRIDERSELDFVDVPGHDGLVGNMLVGAGEIDAALLVVASDDGPRAQTLEHLELLDALGIEDGVAVVTKTDAADPERVAAVVEEVRALLTRTSLRNSPVVAVSALRGDGVPELRDALVALNAHVLARGLPVGPARLAVDRVFSVKGRGAVVTGTLRGGPLERGVALRVVPGDASVRIREIQVHGTTVERVHGGGRTALNLAAVEGASLRRGVVLTAATDRPRATDRVLVALRPPARLGAGNSPLPADRARVRVHSGTEQVGAVVGRSGRDASELPDGRVTAILRLERPIALATGDRFVLRRPSPPETLAAGIVVDVEPPRGVSRRRTTPDRLARLAAAIAEPDREPAARLDLHGALAGPPPLIAADVRDRLTAVALETAAATDEPVPLADLRAAVALVARRTVTLTEESARLVASAIVDAAVAEARLVRVGDRVTLPGRSVSRAPSDELLAAMDRLEAALDVAAPLSLADAARAARCPEAGIRELRNAGRIVVLDADLAYAAARFERLEADAVELASRAPLTPAAFRDATGTSRKYVMAILEELNRRGVLRRTAEGHVPGPRAGLAARPAR